MLAIVLRAVDTTDERSGRVLHELYLWADRAVGGPLDPLALVDPGEGLVDVDRLEVTTGGAGQPWLPPDAADEIRRRELDVILRFCAARPRGEILRAPRHGVWSYHFGADEDACDGAPFFQQLAERAPTLDVHLEVLDDEPAASLVLCRSSFGSRGSPFLARHRRVAFWETTHFVVWKLHDLHEFGWDHVRAQALPRARPRVASVARTPTTGDMVRFITPRVASAVVNRVRGQHQEGGVSIRWKSPCGGARHPSGPLPRAPA